MKSRTQTSKSNSSDETNAITKYTIYFCYLMWMYKARNLTFIELSALLYFQINYHHDGSQV